MMMRDRRFTYGLMASLALAIFVSVPAVAQMDNKQAMVDLVIQVQQRVEAASGVRLQREVRVLGESA